MERRRIVLQVRGQIASVIADAHEAKRWFCRLCALRYLAVNGLIASETAVPAGSMVLFEGCPERVPVELLAALDALHGIADEYWQNAPELPGWLYQYYNAPEREAAMQGLRSHEKIAPAHIPAATQLFTPDWIVQSMVQNTLGTLCGALPEWNYFLDAPDGGVPRRSPETVTLLDPCAGTGHILAYAFDALLGLYSREGWDTSAAAERILTQNLCGLDIDPDAAAVCDFVLRMKAAPYLPDILTRRISTRFLHFGDSQEPNAAVYGSLMRPLDPTCACEEMLAAQYDAVITNPPYMGSSGMSRELSAFVKVHYPAGRADLFACFMERCAELTRQDGCFTMIVQHAWMFLSSYQKLRTRMERCTLRDLVHFGTRAFSAKDVGTIVQTAAFTAFGREIPDYPTLYLRLTEQEDKERAYFDENLRYRCTTERFAVIPGKPLCYWITDRMLSNMQREKLGEHCRICQGMTTSDNKRFLRRWYEVPPGSIAFGCKDAAQAQATGKTWFPYNKGGRMRRWYGNHSWVVNYADDGAELRAFHAKLNKDHSGGRLKNADTYFREAVTWSFITDSTRFGVRLQPEGFLFDVAGSCLFPAPEERDYILGLLSSQVTMKILKLYNPTMNFQPENLKNIPLIRDKSHCPEISSLVRENIAIARADWDSSEESWDFTEHPLMQTGCRSLADAYAAWETLCNGRIARMQQNESRLHQVFAEIYGLPCHLDDIPAPTLTVPDPADAAEGLVSFLTGCQFGRYQISGIAPVAENFLSLAELPALLERCLAAVWGKNALADNLAWLETALGMPLAEYCRRELYPAHCRRFHKHPIYWLASSGRRRELCGLLYVHRFGASPVPLLQRIAGDMPDSPEMTQYRQKLAVLTDVQYVPDDGIETNHARFRTVFAAIR